MKFLKPTKGKIILFFIIGIIVLFLEFMKGGCFGPGPNAGPFACLSPILSIFYVILNPFFLLGGIIIHGKELIHLFATILFITLQILYTYLISCLIIYIFKRK